MQSILKYACASKSCPRFPQFAKVFGSSLGNLGCITSWRGCPGSGPDFFTNDEGKFVHLIEDFVHAVDGEDKLVAVTMVEDDGTILNRSQMATVAIGLFAVNLNVPLTEEGSWRRHTDTGKLCREMLLNFQGIRQLESPFPLVLVLFVFWPNLVTGHPADMRMLPDYSEPISVKLEQFGPLHICFITTLVKRFKSPRHQQNRSLWVAVSLAR